MHGTREPAARAGLPTYSTGHAGRLLARHGHFYAVGTGRYTQGWPFRRKGVARFVASLHSATSRRTYRVYRHDQ